MKIQLLFCSLVLSAFAYGMEEELKEQDPANAALIKMDKIEQCRVKMDKDEQYRVQGELYRIYAAFGEAYRNQSLFSKLTETTVSFADLQNESKPCEITITYKAANDILHKFAKKVRTMMKNEEKRKKIGEEINSLYNEKEKVKFENIEPRGQYLMQVAALMQFYTPSGSGKHYWDRILYGCAWATGNLEKIKKALALQLYDKDGQDRFFSLRELYKKG